MNKNQKVVLSLGCVVAVLACLYPPVQLFQMGESNASREVQFHWIGDMSSMLHVHLASLALRLALVCAVTGTVFAMSKTSKS